MQGQQQDQGAGSRTIPEAEQGCVDAKLLKRLLTLQQDSEPAVRHAVAAVIEVEALLPVLGQIIEEQEAPEAVHWTSIMVGSRVRVSQGVTPRRGWGSVRPGSLGVVTKLTDGGDCKIDFPEMSGWNGVCEELQMATSGITGG